MQVILLVPGLYMLATILYMIFRINILIRRIIKVEEENANLSQKGHLYKSQLLVCENEGKKISHEKKMSFILIVLMIFFFLSRQLMIDILYIKWGLGFGLILFLLLSLKDISRFFCDLVNKYHHIITKDDKFAEAFLGKDFDWKEFKFKWRNGLVLNVLLFF